MAEYNSDGTTVSVYNTETRSFDTVVPADPNADTTDITADEELSL